MLRARTAVLSAALLAFAGCARERPPAELGGLWSAGQAACAAGVGVRFTEDAIEAVYENQRETLFASPRYRLEGRGDAFRVRIQYDLPHRPGGARGLGARGVLVLARDDAGRLAPVRHNMLDGRTGAARLRFVDDPAVAALSLEPCGPHPWRGGLRGLSTR